VNLVHLVGFIIEKFVTMHGNTIVKFSGNLIQIVTFLDKTVGTKTT